VFMLGFVQETGYSNFSMLIYVFVNAVITNKFHTNSSVHEINTRYKNQLLSPVVSHYCYQCAVYYCGLRIFNSLPSAVSDLRMTNFATKLR
jgi:hypothetical protein